MQYDYLAHAILGLAASHLSQTTNVNFSAEALSHRVKAIRLVNMKLSQPISDVAEGDALFATLMCLTHQTLLMEDAIVEFLTMLRGCNLVATSVMPSFEGKSVFKMLTPTGHNEAMKRVIVKQGEPIKDQKLVAAFEQSVQQLAPLCTRQLELAYFIDLQSVTATAKLSSAAGKST